MSNLVSIVSIVTILDMYFTEMDQNWVIFNFALC